MRAMILDEPGPVETRPLSEVEAPDPVPAADELLLAVSACGICRTDLHVLEGDLPPRKSPVIPGHQVVGRVQNTGESVTGFEPGAPVGAAWLHRTCGACGFCTIGRENLCDNPEFCGWTVDGGFAELITVPAAFTYPIPEGFEDTQAAPLLCAGIIGYRALRLTGIDSWPGAKLGIYGFGAAGHVVIQLARARGAEVFVSTRDRTRHQALAEELGAAWVGSSDDRPPSRLDASIIFAPAGELVPVALEALDKGGTLVLGGIHMSAIPQLEYDRLYDERCVRSVANNTRSDGRELLAEAASIPVRTHVEVFDLDRANEALIALKHDAIRGAGVLRVAPPANVVGHD